ncbi:MAG: hypothetical protein HZB31_10180 [Nitrospirae bacterium]|nr:hypothetical protein [Nitrospirota bacterium]
MTDTLLQLREMFPSLADEADSLEVLVCVREDAVRVRAFAAMSGFRTELCREDDHYRISISGSSCGCCR